MGVYHFEYLKYLSRRDEHLQQARACPNALAEYAFRDQAGAPLRQGRIHREWQAAFADQRFCTIIAPRNHGKTIQATQIRVLWELGNCSELIFKIIGANDFQARKRVKALRQHMERNIDLHRVFPVLKHTMHTGGGRPRSVPYDVGEWNLGSLTIPRKNWWALDPSIQAKSILASISGDRADVLVFDDAADRRNSIELPQQRKRIVEGIDDFVNVLHPRTGRAWAIGTLWHHADLHHHFMQMWPTYWYEITVPQMGSYVRAPDGTERHDDEPLWPEGWPADLLKERLKVIKLRKFLRGFGNRPMVAEEQHIKPEWISYYDGGPTKDWHIVISVDAASTTGPKSDWTALVFLAVHPDVAAGRALPQMGGTIKVFQAYHLKITAPEKARLIENLYRQMREGQFKLDGIAIENRGGGQELLDYLLESDNIPSRLLWPVKPKSNKGDRLDRIAHYVDNDFSPSVVQFNPRMNPGLGNVNVDDEMGNVISEITTFPLAEYDDLADAFSQGVWCCVVNYRGFTGILAAATDDLDGDEREAMPGVVEEAGGAKVWII